jgi:uncharacterized integral membrane protein (TIGR00697 family)
MLRKDIVFLILGAFFVTNAVLAELIGGKVIFVGGPELRFILLGYELGPFPMSVGVIPWPVVFVTTDLVNEYFGRRGVRRLTLLTVVMISYAFVVLFVTMEIPAAPFGVDGDSFNTVFGQSRWIIVGSILAFAASQLVDVFIFHVFRRRTGKRLLWLRATGSTIVSQLIDSIVVLYIGLALPLGWTAETFFTSAATNYSVKLLIALAMTPVIYLGHSAVERFLGKPNAEALAEAAAAESERALEV